MIDNERNDNKSTEAIETASADLRLQEQSRRLNLHAKYTFMISMVVVSVSLVILPLELVILISVYTGLGTHLFNRELLAQGGKLCDMGHTVSGCLKHQLMMLAWPVALAVLRERSSQPTKRPG